MTVTSDQPGTTGSNRYLRDNFAPVREELTATDLTVTGALPDHLDGRYLRIGPNPMNDPGEQHHWFLGEGMVHGVRLRDGQAQWYRNRWVRSASVATALGEPVRGTPAGSTSPPTPTCSSTPARTLALVEAGSPPYELTHDLDTVGPCDFRGTLPEHPRPAGLHGPPARGPRHRRAPRGVLQLAARQPRRLLRARHLRARSARSVDVTVHGSPMIHDFALTEHHVVILDLPVTFDIAMATADVPRPVRPVVRGLLNRIIGRNPVPEPLIARVARGSGGGAARAPLPLEPRLPRADRAAAPRRRRRRRPLVRDRPLLRLPHAQRLRGRRPGGRRRRPAPADVRHRAQRARRGPGHADPLHARPHHRPGLASAASTSAPRSSRGTTSG